jgi:hypothetical protein
MHMTRIPAKFLDEEQVERGLLISAEYTFTLQILALSVDPPLRSNIRSTVSSHQCYRYYNKRSLLLCMCIVVKVN